LPPEEELFKAKKELKRKARGRCNKPPPLLSPTHPPINWAPTHPHTHPVEHLAVAPPSLAALLQSRRGSR
jgi:hypothetical protein